MYEVGDRIFLVEGYDRHFNRANQGKYVKIIAIDRHDGFLPYCVRTQDGTTNWIDKDAIKCRLKLLGIRV